MAEYHVGCGTFGIYCGTVKANGTEWKDKTECTDEAVEATRDYMVQECLGGFACSKAKYGGWSWKLKDGRAVELTVKIKGDKE